MLRKLSVQNFALIENANLEFNKGFTVITGETGSGKSILLGALSLILGERANYSVIRDEKKKTIVEAVFDLSNYALEKFFISNDLDFNDETIVRREINATGKSRAFINDTPVQLILLKQLTEQLIYINSQHNTLALKTPSFQLDVLDILAETISDRSKVSEKYTDWISKTKKLEELKLSLSEEMKAVDFNTFQLEEIESLELSKNNYTELSLELERAENSGDLVSAFNTVSEGLNSDEGALTSINKIVKSIGSLKDELLVDLAERLTTVKIELDDISQTAEQEAENVEIDPNRLEMLTSNVDAYHSILKKHNLDTQEELNELSSSLAEKVNSTDELQIEIDNLILEISKDKVVLDKLATSLSTKRKKAAKKIQSQIESLLNEVKLKDSTFIFELKDGKLSKNGIDDLSILFTPNKGMAPQQIEKSASGGELSRVMLVLQALMSKKKSLPTLIFDEIDTGVSGEVADRIGVLLKDMGAQMQLFAITHLPQVASKGNHHILVSKSDVNKQTITELQAIEDQDRVLEIAKLMSGSEINDAAISNAKKLMEI